MSFLFTQLFRAVLEAMKAGWFSASEIEMSRGAVEIAVEIFKQSRYNPVNMLLC